MTIKKTAVIVVDVQGDFTELKDGSLAVKGTDQSFIDEVQVHTVVLKRKGFPIIATQDWHPRQHISFYTKYESKKAFDVITIHGKQQVLWPPHCVQETEGANLLLDEKLFDVVVKKGMEINFDSYSGFKDDGGNQTSLHPILQKWGVTRLVIYGIATDYCVKATALDAIDFGYQVIVIKNLTRGVDPEMSDSAIDEMRRCGVVVLDKLDLEKIKFCNKIIHSTES